MGVHVDRFAVGMLEMLLVSGRSDLHVVSLDVLYFTDVVLPLNHTPPLRNTVAADLDPITGLSLSLFSLLL